MGFAMDFHSDFEDKREEYQLYVQAENKLRKLTEGYTDIRRVAVNISRPTVEQRESGLYKVRVVAYMKPDALAAVNKGRNPTRTLKHALDSLENQVQARRNEGASWK